MSSREELRFRLHRGIAALVIAIATATLAQNLLGLSFSMDELLFDDPVATARGLAPGRMSPATALNFVLLGLALAARRPEQPDSPLALGSVLAAALISFVALAGYLFSVRSL